jgi:peroxiredoxin
MNEMEIAMKKSNKLGRAALLALPFLLAGPAGPAGSGAAFAGAEGAAKAPPQQTGAELGKPAPDFTLTDLSGKAVRLRDLQGKKVVLEWFNPDCPFIKYAHGQGPLKDMAARYAKKGIVWLAVNSGAPGKQGHGAQRNQAAAKEYGLSHPILLDEDGKVGKLYGAKTTPHMYLINEKGVLVYRGAIDNAPMGEPDGGGKVLNYVDAAMEDLAAGKAVRTAETRAYGCSVKYGS